MAISSDWIPIEEDSEWVPIEPQRGPLPQITPNLYEQLQSNGRIDPFGARDTDFLSSVANDPVGFAKSLPMAPFGVLGEVGNLVRSGAADLTSAITGDKQYGGNLSATPGNELPVDRFLGEVAETNPRLALLGNLGQSATRFAPSLALGAIPGMAGKAAIGGFTALGIKDSGELARELGSELGKPEDERDKGKVSQLTADLALTSGMTGLGGFGLVAKSPIVSSRPTTEPISVRDISGDLNRMMQRASDERALEAGSPFLRESAPVEPIQMQLGEALPQWLDPSGLRMARDTALQQVINADIPATPELRALLPRPEGPTVQPPAPTIAPEYQSGRAAQALREIAAEEARKADFKKAIAEKVSQEQVEPVNPNKPLTENQLRIVKDSLKNAVESNLGPKADGPGLLKALENAAKEAQKRLDERAGKVTFGSGPFHEIPNALDYAIILANKIAKGGYDFAKWSADAVKQYGESIKPHLQEFWNEANNQLSQFTRQEPLRDTVTLYQGSGAAEGGGLGGSWWTANPGKAATFGKNMKRVEVPREVANQAKAMAEQQGQGGDTYLLGDEWIRRAVKSEDAVQKVYELDDVVEVPLEKTVSEMAPDAFFDQAQNWSKAAMQDPTGNTKSLQRLAESAAESNPDLSLWQKNYEAAQADAKRIQSEIMTDPASMMTRQKEMMGAAQKAQFFQEGIKKIQANESRKGLISGSRLEQWADAELRDVSGWGRTSSLPVDVYAKKMAAVAVKGAAMMERGIVNSAEWTAEMLKQYGPEIRPRLAEIRKMAEELRQESFIKASTSAKPKLDKEPAPVEEVRQAEPKRESAKEPVSEPGLQMRSLSERGTVAESVPEPVQERIKSAEESYYEAQNLSGVEEASRAKSDRELAASDPLSETYTSDKLELVNRLFNSGDMEGGYRVFQDTSKELTRMGQVINQAKLLNALKPEYVPIVVSKELVKAGRDPLNPKQTERLTKVSQERIDSGIELNRATDRWIKNPTDENAVLAEKALIEANKKALAEQRMVHTFQHKSLAAILKSTLQGNLLTPISQVANIVGNMSFSPFRGLGRGAAVGFDVVDSYLSGRPRQASLASPKQTVAGLIKGLKQIPDIFVHGPGDVIKGESRAGLHPLEAWVKQFAKNADVPTVKGKVPMIDRVSRLIEGTLGAPAEIMLRGLSAGDIAFREAARARLISEQSKLAGLNKSQQRMAQNFPELFFSKEKLKLIDDETRGALFQRSSDTIQHAMSWLKNKGEWYDLAVATVVPYKLTPWNIVGEILSYNPLIAAGRTIIEAKRGNKRAAEVNAGKILVGSTLIAAGTWLYRNGLIAPSMDSSDERQKARVLAGEVLPPNHINISGLKRKLLGGSGEFVPGDYTVDMFRGGGLAGAMFYLAANVGRRGERNPEGENRLMDLLKDSTIEQARFGLNQSFLKGVAGLLEAIQDDNSDSYLQQYASTVMSVPLPNTLSALSRASREYKPDLRSPKTIDKLENALRNRLGIFGADDDLPLKRGLWGEPIRERPESANPLVYELLDISKGKQVTSDPVNLELYRLWRKTDNSSVIPEPPQRNITIDKVTYPLTPERYSRLQELVGKQRREIIEQIVVNPEYHQLSEEQKINILEEVYRSGAQRGKALFMSEGIGDLVPKPKRAGFEAQ